MQTLKLKNSIIFLAVFVGLFCISKPGHAETRSLWERRGKKMQDTTPTEEPLKKEPLQKQIDPLNIEIPEQYGTIIETHRGSRGKLIVHIQDAHANYEGQKNVANILEALIKDYDLGLILLEGKLTDRDFTYIRERAPLEERIQKADKLLKEGVINGVNYLNIASDYPMAIQGIEDKAIYDSNRDMLWEIDNFKGIAVSYVEKLIITSNTLKPRIYNKRLLELDNKKKDYENENIDLLTYYDYLYKKAEEKEIPLYVFPNFGSLIKANDLEKKIDLIKIRSGDASENEIALYNEYTKLSKDLNINALFKEEPFLEDTLKDALAENIDQKKLLKISKALSIVKNLLNIKVVPEEYKYFAENRKDFDPQAWTSFLEEKSNEFNLSLDIPSNSYVISDNLPKIEKFYNIADERNHIFLRKINGRIEKDKVNLAALIAGGFHTPRLTKLLNDEGYSYVVISPKVTEKTDDKQYRSMLKREWLPDIK